MNTPEKCPKCGANNGGDGWEFVYDCGSYFDDQESFNENKGECVLRQRDQLAERVKRLEEAGEELRKASRTFLLTHVDDDDGNEDAISIDQVNPESAVQWEDPPSAGEHARLRNAINGWCKAKVQP